MTHTVPRSIKERIFHACTFEFFAIIFTMFIGTFLLNKPASSMGILSVLISITALMLNIIFNWLFDRVFPFIDGDRPVKIRMLHAIGFEGTLMSLTIPMIAVILQVSLLDAFMIEIGFLAFFLFYTYTYNWIYDKLRKKILSQ